MDKIKTTSKQRTVLFIDSDKELIHDLKDYMEHHELKEKYGLDFIFAENCRDAMKKIAEQHIDLVVLEVVLPVINGYYFLNALKKEKNNIPVIIYSRLKGPQDLAKMASYKVDNIFLKQLMKMEDLIQMIIGHEGYTVELDKVLLELQSQVKSLATTESQSSLKVTQCPRCHMILPQDSHFCNNCGQKIFRVAKQVGLKKPLGQTEDSEPPELSSGSEKPVEEQKTAQPETAEQTTK